MSEEHLKETWIRFWLNFPLSNNIMPFYSLFSANFGEVVRMQQPRQRTGINPDLCWVWVRHLCKNVHTKGLTYTYLNNGWAQICTGHTITLSLAWHLNLQDVPYKCVVLNISLLFITKTNINKHEQSRITLLTQVSPAVQNQLPLSSVRLRLSWHLHQNRWGKGSLPF